ncbi:MAG: sulfatase [Anaerolineae bacterium]|nr:sulfatase [Anaerolineae bacterium]
MLPNILFITCHDLGQHLGCYGQSTVISPNLDALAYHGVRFENHFCTAPQCSPSHSSLHTGRYPHSNGVMGLSYADFGWDLYPDEVHIVQHLRNAGYDTALVGVQHITSRPERLGYDMYYPMDNTRGEAQTAADYLRNPRRKVHPFYLEVGFFEPHRPYYDEKELVYEVSRGVALPGYVPHCSIARMEFAALQGAIRRMDTAVGKVLETLHETGLEDNTWVIFTTDHGIAMPRAKCTLYDPGIETALIMRWPAAGIMGGAVYNDLISNVDIVPTMLDALGLPQPGNLQGQSFWPRLQDRFYIPRAEIFAEKTYHNYYHPQRAIRTATHKLIVNLEEQPAVQIPGDVMESNIYLMMIQSLNQQPHVPIEFYDLYSDRWEQNNLAGQPETIGVERTLKSRLFQWMQETDDPLLNGAVTSPFHATALHTLNVAN